MTSSGFNVHLQEGSLSDGINTGETVRYIAVSTGGDGQAGYASIHDGLDAGTTSFALGGTLTDGVVFAETQTVNETDAGNVVLTNGSTGTITAKFDEETGDGESVHGNEAVGLIGFEDGIIPCFIP